MELVSTQQFESEHSIFDYSEISIQLPLTCSVYHHTHKPLISETMKGLKSTSKVALNIALVDDTLFISTLTREPDTKKTHNTSLEEPSYITSSTVYYAASERRPSEMSSSSSTSTESDLTHSTELIRRFSSTSTTSTVATSYSSASVDAQTKDKMKLNQYHEEEEEEKGRATDPGHGGDTMHSPYKSNEAYNNNNNNNNAPVWVDPIKMKQNPSGYEYIKEYMQENQISVDSSLRLSKACVFYFSDTNQQQQSYMSAVKSVFECDTVWQFSARWRIYKQSCSKKPSQLLPNQNLFCFKKGVKPMWEDKVNETGGRLIITVQSNLKLLDDLFERILCGFIGAALFDYGVVGIVVSRRNRADRIELWLDQSNSTTQTISSFK
ncbi:translation initiation factor eIF 4e-like domain-containing protein [Helicostylum pulchrum]|nr:translation initiation factor eIF 4e-like domain-containing protein [Helicostylum pulchrum]